MNSARTLLISSAALMTGQQAQCFAPTHLHPQPPASPPSLSAGPYPTRLAHDMAAPSGINGDSDGTMNAALSAEEYFAAAEVLEFEMVQHKPLGCRAEESLADEPDGAKHVFISEVNEGGFSAKAGIKVGDVVVGISGSFEDVANVAGLGLDRVRSLVSAHPDEETLVLRVARGTDVMERHETAIVDICTFNEGIDSQIEECIINLNQYDYGFEDDEPTVDCGNDEDMECLLDQMFDEWGEEMVPDSSSAEEGSAAEGKEKEEPTKPKVAPWSSRSSPSGTFVRDPATGEMRNIDAQ